MLQFDPNDPEELAFALSKAVKKTGLTLTEISAGLEQEYGVSVKASAISHAVWRGGIRFQRALQKLAVCGVTEIEIKNSD
jgi:transposase